MAYKKAVVPPSEKFETKETNVSKVDKETMVDVELNPTHINESIGEHIVNIKGGCIHFFNGKATVTQKIAEELKKALVIK